MKYFTLLVLLFFFTLSSFASIKSEDKENYSKTVFNSELKTQADAALFSKVEAMGEFKGGLIWQETFETPASWTKWMSKDNTLPRPLPGPSEWVINDWQAYDGTSWRCANLSFGDNGGYDNGWYQVLDTPPLLLDENATFSFFHRYAVEGPGGATAPYDAWDGLNVRISVDGGVTWQVLPASSYNVSSIWAFGHPVQGHNEGPGIAGWAGEMHTWTQESFDLSPYTSSTNSIILRFAMASDQAYSTADGAPALYGWQIDNIEVKSVNKTYFSNMGVDEDLQGNSNEFIPPAGEDLWHIVKIRESLPALTSEFEPFGQYDNYALSCQNSGFIFDPEATYNPYMDNIAFTGPISIPDAAPVYLDYKYIPFFIDQDAFPEVEFFRPEVSIDGENWEYIESDPYVYSFAFDQWLEFSWVYGYPRNMSMFDLSRFAGQDIYLSFRFWSDHDTPAGHGLLVDDIAIYSPTRYIPKPVNVQAEADAENMQVALSWGVQNDHAIYSVWRQKQGESTFSLLAETMGDTHYMDSDIEPYFTYNYLITTTVKYQGRSAPSELVSAEIIPSNVLELYYDDGSPDSSITAEANQRVGVKFTPASYPVTVEALKIYLDATGTSGTAGRFAVYDDDGSNGMPGTRLTYALKSGLSAGYNPIVFNTPVTISEGSFYLTYFRFGTGLKSAVDLDEPIAGRTYIQTSSGWEQQMDFNAIFHAYLDTSATTKLDFVSGLEIVDDMNQPQEFILYKNYPNPFNPTTTLSFNVPEKYSGEHLSLSVYNILGEKISSLFIGKAQAGLNTMRWDGRNAAGAVMNSGVYIVRLQSKDINLSQRILLMK